MSFADVAIAIAGCSTPKWKSRKLPHTPTLLTDTFNVLGLDFENQQDWSADEWKRYALFLEQEHERLSTELDKTRKELQQERAKHTRRKPSSEETPSKKTPVPTLLSGGYKELLSKRKRGRPPESKRGSKYDPLIKKARKKQKQMEVKQPWTKVVDLVLEEEGLSKWRARAVKKTILNHLYKNPNN